MFIKGSLDVFGTPHPKLLFAWMCSAWVHSVDSSPVSLVKFGKGVDLVSVCILVFIVALYVLFIVIDNCEIKCQLISVCTQIRLMPYVISEFITFETIINQYLSLNLHRLKQFQYLFNKI